LSEPALPAAGFTVLSLRVPDVETAVDELTAKGVAFEQHDSPKTDSKGIHIATPKLNRWLGFATTGNIIALDQN